MNQSYTPPSTIDGISRLAKSIRKERGIRHTSALDIAATRAGFQNFKNAKRELSSQGLSIALQPLYLTVYWRNRDARQVCGRCTAEVKLPPDTLNRLKSLKDRGYWMLGGFELESTDHLQARLDDSSLDQAKKRITDAVRELQFCVATGLRRMRKVADKNRVTFLQHLPSKDHMSIWIEESTGSWLALDEPYHIPYGLKASEREKWIAHHNLATISPNWDGLYCSGLMIPDTNVGGKIATPKRGV